ncbi:Cytochrome c oxidase assembly protein cox15 [Podochytrium sp. JEL0797]|nr:Cytochrome c oxidase assembly protein cox15 [Podochytrium sp. JEL0797]
MAVFARPLLVRTSLLLRPATSLRYPASLRLAPSLRALSVSLPNRAAWPKPVAAPNVRKVLNANLISMRSTPTKSVAPSIPKHFSTQAANESTTTPTDEPQTKAIVGWWYLYCASLVFLIVAVGGVTRLTESGLSIVEWNLIKGMKPPRTQEEWEAEFEKYKQFPEYKLLNHNITLSEFKFIFWFEWGHRMLGRFIGLSFILPGIYFASKGYMTRAMQIRSLVIGTLIGGQGVLGWYMVKSGLREECLKQNSFHGVSQYWLAAHLGSAFVLYSAMILTGFEVLRTSSKNARFLAQEVTALLKVPGMKLFAMSTHQIATLVLITAFSGAFVAGLDAGLLYNEFPYMGNGFMPSDMWAMSDPTVMEHPIPKWRNLLENGSAVQFGHRVLAMTTATAVVGLWVASRRFSLPRSSRMAVNTLLGVTALQVSLGISTLLYFVPVPLAAAHQCGSLMLMTASLWLLHTLRRLPVK